MIQTQNNAFDLSYTLTPFLNVGTGCEYANSTRALDVKPSSLPPRTQLTFGRQILPPSDTIKLHNVSDPTNVFATSETFEVKAAGSAYPPLVTTLPSTTGSSPSSTGTGGSSASNTAAAASASATTKTSAGEAVVGRGKLGRNAKLALMAVEMVGVVWGLENLVV